MGLARLIETRAIGRESFDLAGTVAWGGATDSGVAVTEDVALSVPTFASCVRQRSRALMAMPVDAYVNDGDLRVPVPGPRWLAQPNSDQLWPTFVAQVSQSFDLAANAFLAIMRDKSGRVAEVWPLDHRRVTVGRHNGAKVIYVDGRPYGGEVRHIIAPGAISDGLKGRSVIDVNAETFGLAAAVQGYAAGYFGSGAIPPFVIEAPNGMDEEGVKLLRSTWLRAHRGRARQHLPGILTNGATAKRPRCFNYWIFTDCCFKLHG